MPDAEVFFNILKVAGFFVGLSFIVFWVGLVWWVSQDILTRTSDKIIVAAAVAMTAILGPVGVMFYLIIRPKQTLKESYGEMMEHEMMLRAAASTICPMCEHMTQEDFVNCPYCGTVLKKQCSQCQKLVSMDWGFCPYCGTVADNRKAALLSRLEPTTIKEVEQAKEIEAIKQGISQPANLSSRQNSTTSSLSLGINNYGIDKISQARHSAMSMLKQAFATPASPSTPASSSGDSAKEVVGASGSNTEQEASSPTTEPSVEVEGQAPTKKRTATKKRTTKRSKK